MDEPIRGLRQQHDVLADAHRPDRRSASAGRGGGGRRLLARSGKRIGERLEHRSGAVQDLDSLHPRAGRQPGGEVARAGRNRPDGHERRRRRLAAHQLDRWPCRPRLQRSAARVVEAPPAIRRVEPDITRRIAINLMKAGLVSADKITTVSPTYMNEIQTDYYGEKLNGLLLKRKSDLIGILNGIDDEVYHPEKVR